MEQITPFLVSIQQVIITTPQCSGRSKDPKALHFNKEVRSHFIPKGCGYELLPPKGAEFNPIELYNGHLQREVLKSLPEGGGRDCHGQLRRGPKNRREAIVALDGVLERP